MARNVAASITVNLPQKGQGVGGLQAKKKKACDGKKLSNQRGAGQGENGPERGPTSWTDR